MKQCCIIRDENKERCERPGVCSIEWPDGGKFTICWYCAEHYDEKIAQLRESGRIELLKGTGVR
jgi:hypothetical protein